MNLFCGQESVIMVLKQNMLETETGMSRNKSFNANFYYAQDCHRVLKKAALLLE